MIAKNAYSVYRRISREHKRWLDPEDLIQEGFLTALKKVTPYDRTRGAKYSTYLYRGLSMEGAKFLFALHGTEKRGAKLIELDAPRVVGEEEVPGIELPSPEVECTDLEGLVRVFVMVYRRLSSQAAAVLAGGLLCGRATGSRVQKREGVLDEIRRVVRENGVTMRDFSVLGSNEKIRRKVLQRLAADVNIGLGIEMDARILECVGCKSPFSLAAVKSGRFIAETMTCRACYKDLQRASETCFGKVKTSTHEGFSGSDIECRLHCQDRAICQQYIQKRTETTMAKVKAKAAKVSEEVEELDELNEVDTVESEDADETEVPEEVPAPKKLKKGTAKATTKAEKPAKAAKAKVEGPDLPFKADSLMRAVLVKCLDPKGATEKGLEKFVVENGYSWPLQRRTVLAGKNSKSGSDPTHTWTVDAEGGTIKVTNVKRVKVKKAAAA
jgi:hypothetical protein